MGEDRTDVNQDREPDACESRSHFGLEICSATVAKSIAEEGLCRRNRRQSHQRRLDAPAFASVGEGGPLQMGAAAEVKRTTYTLSPMNAVVDAVLGELKKIQINMEKLKEKVNQSAAPPHFRRSKAKVKAATTSDLLRGLGKH